MRFGLGFSEIFKNLKKLITEYPETDAKIRSGAEVRILVDLEKSCKINM